MFFERSSSAATAPRLVVRDGLAARQWEAHFYDVRGDLGGAWVTPPFIAYRAWRRDLSTRALARDAQRALLTPEQCRALWRKVVAESPAGEHLLEVATGARWAADARRLLADWNVDIEPLRADRGQTDFAAFLAWHRAYLDRLAAHAWVDEAESPAALLAEGTPEPLLLLDLDEPTPAERDLLRRLEEHGVSIARETAPVTRCRARRVALGDSREELRVAAAWAKRALRERPRCRVAIVVPGLRRQLARVQQVLREILGEQRVGFAFDAPLTTRPLIGAAVSGIELSSTQSTFATLSRWLRSPFFHGADVKARSRAATVEASLRPSVASQLDFLIAYEKGGLATRLERDVPELAARLRDGLREMRKPRERATLDVWARAWTRGLAKLGWPATATAADDPALRAFDAALATLTRLTPITGELEREQAIAELRTILEQPGAAPLPLFGVHVLEHIDDVGPGYTGVWVTGLTDQQWPEQARMNPLLPRRLQVAHGLPWATPADAMARARLSQERLLRRTPEVVFSWPAVIHDYATQASPLLAAIAGVGRADLGVELEPAATTRPRALERIDDPAPALAGSRIDGGARTLDLQARCPVRAFCERRLQARALESPISGLGARGQGIAIHRALERLLRLRPSQEALRAGATTAIEDVRRCVEEALATVFGSARAPLSVLFDLECARTSALLARFVASELNRPPFRVVSVEERTDVTVGEWAIACRIDRIDEIADGTWVLIDYKTGRAFAGAVDWLRDRLTDTQLPLYALKGGTALSGILTIGLAGKDVSYRGIAAEPTLVAESVSALPEGRSWTEQVERWRLQIRALVDAYAGGDTRIYLDDPADAQGAYAPLTRIYGTAVGPAPESEA
jgi:ATP-dependent helicase/nuclease subunit B